MPELDARARDEPMLASVDALLQDGSLSLADLRETRQLQITGPADGENYFVTFSPLNFSDWVVATVIPASDFLASIELPSEASISTPSASSKVRRAFSPPATLV
ncbi:MAG TPA: hypothetical protein VNU19_16800, partial [Candidatus Acidoferrum sp.]|nr:hypothetical protein [Candidatus Acidoferrum sp.]